VATACILATLAFWAYAQTLLPGVDLGDTGGFQAAVLWPEVSARQAYPLYHGLARSFVLATSPAKPAIALNLFSSIWGAAAVGLVTFLCSSVVRSHAAGAAAGLLLAFSYTFWSQAVIAEVYTLHLTLIGLCLLALRWYAAGPSFERLLVFLGVYALAFGNHLSMILLLVPFAIFLFQTSDAPRDLLNRRVVLAAIAIAALGALQYAPNFMSVAGSFSSPGSWTERFAAFWFDTTKQDWRESMVLGVDADEAGDRLAMWWFDSRQQFGIVGLALAAGGLIALWRESRPWGLLVLTLYAASTAFALTYNVGDAHVFFLPAHFATAFAAGAGVYGVGRLVARRPAARLVVVGLALIYAGWRGWDTWPVIDRHEDRRGEQLIATLTQGVRDSNAVFVSQMNWQLENVLLYTSRHLRPDLSWVRLGDVLTHWPFFAADNLRLGRDVVLEGQAAQAVASLLDPDALVPDTVPPSLEEVVDGIPQGTPYVLTVLRPPRETPLDEKALAAAMASLNGGTTKRDGADFEVMAGLLGVIPEYHHMSERPFRESFTLLGDRITIRMESWLPTDTFRRAGFGHVLRGRERLMILERGVNLIWLGRNGRVAGPYYAASLFAPQPRFRLPAATLQYAGTAGNALQ
jgi:hypothetical protein